MNEDIDPADPIDAFLEDGLTPEAEAELLRRIQDDPEARAEFVRRAHLHHQLKDLLSAQSEHASVAADAAAVEERKPAGRSRRTRRSRTPSGGSAKRQTPRAPMKPVRRWPIYAALAASLLAAVGIYFAMQSGQHPEETMAVRLTGVFEIQENASAAWTSPGSETSGEREFVWKEGQAVRPARGTARIDLKDGSHVMVQGESLVRLKGAKPVRLELENGEIFCDVATEESSGTAPKSVRFIVDTATAVVRVTGTQFGVKRDGGHVEVAVLKGTVVCANKAGEAPVSAGHATAVQSQEQIPVVSVADVDERLAWHKEPVGSEPRWETLQLKEAESAREGIQGIAANARHELFILFGTKSVYQSTDHGTTWRTVSQGLPQGGLFALGMGARGELTVSGRVEGDGRAQCHSLQPGVKTWELSTNGGVNARFDAFGVHPSGRMLAAYNGRAGVAWSDDGGRTFKAAVTEEIQGCSVRAFAFHKVSGDVYALTDRGVMHSINRGEAWKPAEFPNAQAMVYGQMCAMAFNRKDELLFSASDSHSPEPLFRWSLGPKPAAACSGLPRGSIVRSLAVTTNGTLFASVFNQGVYVSTDDGATWTEFNRGMPSNQTKTVLADGDGNLFVGLQDGRLCRVRLGRAYGK